MSLGFLPGPGIPGLVSIVIPTFNRAHFIAATIESALAQTYSHHEVIVVDDASTDNTAEVVGAFSDRRIQYLARESNGGFSLARNLGLSRAKGEFIAFLDSDDVWLPWKLGAQIRLFQRHPEVGMSWSDMWVIDPDGTPDHTRYLRTLYNAFNLIDFDSMLARAGSVRELTSEAPSSVLDAPYFVGNIFDQMFLGNIVHPPTAILRRSRLRQAGKFEPGPTGNAGVDYEFYFRVTRHGPVALIDAPTIYYRVHPNQISKSNLHEARADVEMVNRWLATGAPRVAPALVRKRLAGSHRWLGHTELVDGARSEARKHLWRSLALEPLQPRTAALFALSLFPDGTVSALRSVKRALRGIRGSDS
jgi:glycosyltransferase involved in cell wall biosynthesis